MDEFEAFVFGEVGECEVAGRRPPHAASSQTSTDGNATLDPAAITVTHAANDPATNIAPIASTPWTNSSARSTTPTWQTSKTEPGAAAA